MPKKAKTLAEHAAKGAKKADKVGKTFLDDKAASPTDLVDFMRQAGVEEEKKVTKLEATFMAPHMLAQPAMYPDCIVPRGCTVFTQEVPIPVTNGRASGTINRSCTSVLTLDDQVTRQVVLPVFSGVGSTGIWTATPGEERTYSIGSPYGANGIFYGDVNYGVATEADGSKVELVEYNIPNYATTPTGTPFPSDVKALPSNVGLVFGAYMSTEDTTANKWRMDTVWVTDTAGILGLLTVTGPPVTAALGRAYFTATAPANSIALATYSIIELLGVAATDRNGAHTISANLNGAPGDTEYPVGGLSQFTELLDVSDKARITALAFHLRNDSLEITAQGEVVAYQQRDDEEAMPKRTVESLSTFKGRFAGRLAKGMYGWVLPWSNTQAQSPLNIVWEDLTIDAPDVTETDRVHWAIKVDPAATNQQLVMVIYAVVEFRTVNSFIPTRVGKLDYEEIEAAMNFMATLPNIMENDSHWQTIKGYLTKGAKDLWRAMRPFLKDVALPAAGSAIMGVL